MLVLNIWINQNTFDLNMSLCLYFYSNQAYLVNVKRSDETKTFC